MDDQTAGAVSEEITVETLIEDVSIDGMCGVY
jgi:mycofactocin precursor